MRLYKVALLLLIFTLSLSFVSAAEDLNDTDNAIALGQDLNVDEDMISSPDVISPEDNDVLASNNSVIYVDADRGNDSNDGLSKDSAVKTIGKAYDLVEYNGTIYLSDGVYDNPQLYLYKSLSIIGSNNTIIDGGNIVKGGFVFRAWSGSYFTFKNIKFMNIRRYGANAKVIEAHVEGSTVIIENCDFINTNTNVDNAANIAVIRISRTVTAYILNCNFINPDKGNSEDYWTIYNLGKLTVNNSKFINASKGFIYTERAKKQAVAILDINNCTFINVTGNSAVYCNAILKINNSSFINCRNGNNGGAICIEKSQFSKSINPIINNCYFESCSSRGGGAIAVYNADSFNLSNSSFYKCAGIGSIYDFGGAVYISKNTNAFLNNIIFSECSAKGAAIYNMGNTILNNSIIKNSKIPATPNMYNYYLGSILNDYGTLTVSSTIFESNYCVGSTFPTCIGTSGIYNRATLDVSYSAFINNKIISQNMYEDIYTESSGIKSLDFNWWGSDENPLDLGLSNYEKIYTWFYLDIVPEYLALNINDTANVTANFKLNNPNIPFDSDKLPKFNITFSSVVNDKLFYESKDLLNNSASVLFNLTQTKGQYVLLTSISSYTKPIIIDIGKNVSLMYVNFTDIVYGEKLKVNVSVKNNNSDFLNGNVTFLIDKKTYNVKLNDGFCTASIPDLNPGNYTLKVVYEGNEDYFKSIQYFNVTVNKIPTDFSISMPEIIYIGNKARFNTTLKPENFKIRANLYLNGNKTNILYIYGGNTTISLGVLPLGEYNFTVELWNHTYYESSTVSKSFKVEKYDVDLIIDADDVKLGENATVTINSSPQDFKGYGMLEINGVNQSIFIYNNQTNITLSNLNPGKYDLKLYYDGDDKFKNATAFASFNVLRNNVTLNITVGEGFILVKTNYTDCTGIVSLYVNNQFYRQNLSNGFFNFTVDFEKGYNYIYAYYSGDDYYEYATVNTTFLVPDTPGLTGEDLIIYEHSGEGYVINLNNDLGYPIADATISIEIGGKKYNVITNWEGYALLPLDLDVGDYILYASYDKFNITNNISVKPINLRISLKDIIAQDQNQTINAKVSKGVIGKIYFELSNNKNYTVDINDDGRAQLTLTNLTAGNYTVKAYYINEFYTSQGVVANFTVFKYYTPIYIDLNDTLHGNDVIINVLLPDDAKGKVSFIINDNTYVKDVINGKSSLTLSNLDVGEYTVDVYYSGDNHYYNTSISKSFNVFKYNSTVNVKLNNVSYGEDVIIAVSVPNAGGSVNVIVNNRNYALELIDSSAELILSDLEVGSYNVEVNYLGDIHYYANSSNATFNVYKLNTGLNVVVGDVLSGDDAVIDVYLDKNATGNITFKVNGKEYVRNVFKGHAVLILSDLEVGSYNVDVYYHGDKHFNNNESNGAFEVYKLNTEVNVIVSDVLSGGDALIDVYLDKNATGNITFKVNGKEYVKDVVGGHAVLILSGLEVGFYNLDVFYSGDKHFNNNESNGAFEVYKLNTVFDVVVRDVLAGEDEIITVNLNKNATGSISFIVDGKEYVKDVVDGVAVLTLSNLKVKTYNLSVLYSGDVHYWPNSKNLTFTIKTAISSIDIQADDINYLEDVIIKANVTEGATGNVTFIINNITKTVQLVNSRAVVNLSGFNAGHYEVIAKYNGDEVYLSSQSTKSFNVNKAESEVNVVVNSVVVGENIRIYAVVSPNATGNVTFRMLGYYSPRNKTINGNNASWLISPLKTGQYTIIAIYNGDNNYLSSNTTYYLSVNQIKTKLNVEINNVSKKSDVFIKANLKTEDDAGIDGQVMVTIGDYDYIVDIKDGYGVLNISKLSPGVYNYSALYSGSKVYYRSTFNGVFEIEDSFVDVKLIANPLIKYYGGSERLVVYLTDEDYNPVKNATLYFTVNGVEYKRVTGGDGSASMAINLISGNYSVNVRFEGFNKFNALSINVNVTVNPTVEGLNITKIFRNATQYYAIFIDSQGNLLKNTNVTFNINGVFYTRLTNGYGIARLNINLNPGEYILTAENPVTGELKSNLITVLSSIVENHDLNIFFRNGSQYVVKLLGHDGRAVANAEVTFNINGVFYTRVSDNDGYARLNINLNPGSYIITAEYNDCRVSNNIVVKPVLFTNDLSIRYGSKASFDATLVDGQGRLYSGQVVTFNINGVFYERTTEDNGVASLNIRLQAGKYIITSSYNGCNVANTITIY